MQEVRKLPYVLMRGGTSKGVFLKEADVPRDRDQLTQLVLALFGSPDRRQIDGLGGADKLTSKVAVIGKPVRAHTDLTYLFGQVGVAAAEVDYKPNCGNLTAAVAVYAIEEGIVPAVEGTTVVRIHNVNTDKVIQARVQVQDGRPRVEGELAIGGVPGTGAPIGLDFSAAAGSATGSLLPVGAPLSTIEVPGHGSFAVSVVDCANLVVFAAADEIGMLGTEMPAEIDGNTELVARINAIRKAVAHRVGLGEYWDARTHPALPLFFAVQKPTTYRTFTTGQEITAAEVDLVCRSYATGSTHQAVPVTATACTGAACCVEGSVAHRYLSARGHAGLGIAIGHPSGIIRVESELRDGQVTVARIFRTARRLADGSAYLREARLPAF